MNKKGNIVLAILVLFSNSQLIRGQNATYCNSAVYGRYAILGTLCRYSPTSFGEACGPEDNHLRLQGFLDTAMQQYIVKRHNDLRTRVASGEEVLIKFQRLPVKITGNETRGAQPGATNMNRIRWSTQLAQAAQTWANRCLIRSDYNRNESTSVVPSTSGNPVYVGQNVYGFRELLQDIDFNETAYWDQAIDRWYGEVVKFNRNGLASYQYSAPTGHYTQIVAASTTLIGCGLMQWGFLTARATRILICNYGPGGNLPGQPIYLAGSSACRNCSLGTTCVDSLCT